MLLYLFFDSLSSTCPKKMETEKWPKAADSPLLEFRKIRLRILDKRGTIDFWKSSGAKYVIEMQVGE